MKKGRESKGIVATADLLVCFPGRSHLSLLPKPIYSPARQSEPSKRHHHHHHKSGGVKGSPLVWAKTSRQTGHSVAPEMDEPTSPKVTCAGQIKVRPTPCRNWQSVMDEIERIRNIEKQRKRTTSWASTLGFKKEVMQFLTCLRNIRFDLRCFGSVPNQDIESDDDDDEEEETDEESSRTVFSKWFMVLGDDEVQIDDEQDVVAPPPNALLLMRSRSAPPQQIAEQHDKNSESLEMLMKYDSDFYNLSSDIAKETWVVGGLMNPICRSTSCKR